jgi:hypothetical protein
MTRVMATSPLASVRAWPVRRWVVATAAAALAVLLIGVPTDLIDTALFSRDVAVTWWAWPALVVTAALAGLVAATYVRSPAAPERRDPAGRWGTVGGVLGFFAVGCPVCNKLVLLALGTSGALRFFQPIQPVLAAASIGMLGWALVTRIRRESVCTVTR